MATENQANGKLNTRHIALLVYVGIGLTLAVLALGMALGAEMPAEVTVTNTPTLLPMVLTVRAQNATDLEEHHGGGMGRGQNQDSHPTSTPAVTATPALDSHGH